MIADLSASAPTPDCLWQEPTSLVALHDLAFLALQSGFDAAGIDGDEADIIGADFEEDILDFLERAHELVVLLTPWALDRPYVWAELGAAWGRRIPIVALLLGITPSELQKRPGTPVFLKKRDLLQLNEVDTYLEQLKARVQQHKGGQQHG